MANQAKPVTFPLINPNEPDMLLSTLHIQEGQQVKQGDLLATLETTKATQDLVAEDDGYVIGLNHPAGTIVKSGDLFFYLAKTLDWKPAAKPEIETAPGVESPVPDGLRITQPALQIARQKKVDLSNLPKDRLVTEGVLTEWLSHAARPAFPLPEAEFEPTSILVYGGGGHGKSLIEFIRSLGMHQVIGVIDDGKQPGSTILGVPVVGGEESLAELHAKGVRLAVNAVGGIGNVQSRIRVFEKLAAAGFVCPALVHPTAFVEASATLAAGAQIFPHAYVGSEAEIGYGVIVNTGAIVSHDCRLGDYANISPGAMLAGEVTIGAGVLVGMGVTINLQVCVGDGARIGNGATIKADVPENGIVRAGKTWPE